MSRPAPGFSVVYLYGFVPQGQPVPCREGAADVALPGVVALADVLPSEGFTGAALEARLQDPAWVTEQARRHTSVLAAAMDVGPVVPARLCTMFTSAAALRDALEGDVARIAGTLERLRGRREWSLKLYVDEAAVRAACQRDDPSLADPADASATGAEWMRRKQRAFRLAERVNERTERASGDALDATAALSADVRLRPLLSEAASGVASPMALNAALLVARDAEAAVRHEAERLAASLGEGGHLLVLSGPWPCFSFCDDDADPDLPGVQAAGRGA